MVTYIMIPAGILLNAYASSVFPMSESRNDRHVEWYTANPRGILIPDEFHCPNRLGRTYRSHKYFVKCNTAFFVTLSGCADVPRDGTWISDEIIESYVNLHKLGYAHSIESWTPDGVLAGGLYGVALGGIFFGESMFHTQTDASKIALVALVDRVKTYGFILIDMQMLTNHMKQFGGKLISQKDYMRLLQQALQINTIFDENNIPQQF